MISCEKVYFLLLVVIISVTLIAGQAAIVSPGDNKLVPDSERIPLPDKKDCSVEDVVCIEEVTDLEAIEALHKQIDDDASGNIDIDESQEFFRDELQNTDGFERQSIFHGKDDKISVEDLWNAWKKSQVFNWTVDDVVEWLIDSVELPQYATLVKERGINGSLLPRVATNVNHFISGKVGIKNPVHKHKLSLKAIDVVLFGPAKKPHHVLKDIVLLTSILVALGGCWIAYRQNKHSKEEITKMMKDLDSLQKADSELSELNEKLQTAEKQQNEVIREKKEIELRYSGEIEKAKQEAERLKKERQGSDVEELSRLQLAEEELIQVNAALVQAEKELDRCGFWGPPSELQQWLQYTYEMEQQHFNAKQQAAQRQFSTAREACEKMRRKRTGMLGTFRVAQGNSIDEIDQRILQARMALEEIRHDLQERQQRWQNIENLCSFPIKSNPGLNKLEVALYGDGLSSSGSNGRLSTSQVAPLNVEEADEDFPPQYSAATAMLFSQKSNGCTRPTASYTDFSVLGSNNQSNYACLSSNCSSRTSFKLQGLGSSLGEVKRRQVNMGSTSSLARSPSGVNPLPAMGKRDSVDTVLSQTQKSPTTSSSNGNHSTTPVSFQLGSHSPGTSPDSPMSDITYPSMLQPLKDKRSKSSAGLGQIQNGSRIPKPDSFKPSPVTESHRNHSDNNLQKRVLSKQTTTIGGVGTSSQDEDSLSGTESLDSEGRRKDKRKLKFIPKFMRKTDSH